MTDPKPPIMLIKSKDASDLVLRSDEITPALAGALRQQSHGAWRVPTLMMAADEGVGPEELAGLVFLARRQMGEEVTYDAVADQVPALGEVRIEFVLEDEVAEAEDADPNV